MSADNWGVCPRCSAARDATLAANRRLLEAQYGKIPASEYVAAVAALDEAENAREPHELREDYAIGIDDTGTFAVAYSGHCRACAFSFDFKHEEEVK